MRPWRVLRPAWRRLGWGWRLHTDLHERSQQGKRLEVSTDQAVEASQGRIEDLQRAGKQLRDRARDNQFAALLVDCLDGVLYRKPGGRVHGTGT